MRGKKKKTFPLNTVIVPALWPSHVLDLLQLFVFDTVYLEIHIFLEGKKKKKVHLLPLVDTFLSASGFIHWMRK